jgi:DNA-binding IclR family transcriptional regulator
MPRKAGTVASTQSPQSVTRVIHIMEALCASTGPLSLAQLSRTLGAPKSSVAALLRGLAQANFVVPVEGGFLLGPAAFGLGSALLEARRQSSSPDLVREGMRRLAKLTGETVLFAVRDTGADTMTYVDLVESRNAVRFTVSAGDRRPLYCTAGGRMLLATLAGPELARYLDRLKPRRLTASTETDKTKLAEAIESARVAGVAQTIDQASEGVTGAAAAIVDATGRTLGSLVVAVPSSRLAGREALLAQQVREEAAAISRNLGHLNPRG